MVEEAMATFHFEVRETTVRIGSVQAESAAEARRLLERWAKLEGHLAEPNGPIVLGDLDSERFTFRSIKEPHP